MAASWELDGSCYHRSSGGCSGHRSATCDTPTSLWRWTVQLGPATHTQWWPNYHWYCGSGVAATRVVGVVPEVVALVVVVDDETNAHQRLVLDHEWYNPRLAIHSVVAYYPI